MTTIFIGGLAISMILLSLANIRLQRRVKRLESAEINRRIWGG